MKTFKTAANPDGRSWPDKIQLDVGSGMPHDVYGVTKDGVKYIRADIVNKQLLKAMKQGAKKAAEVVMRNGHTMANTKSQEEAILSDSQQWTEKDL